MTHRELCACVDCARSTELTSAAQSWSARERWSWLTEVELCARIKAAMVAHGITSAERVRLNAQGRVRAGSSNHDIEICSPLPLTVHIAIEVVWAFTAGRSRVPADGLNADLKWMTEGTERHVVLFLPTVVPGYAVQNNKCFDLHGNQFSRQADQPVLSDLLQVGGLKDLSFKLLTGIISEVANPARGNSRRWTIVANPWAAPAMIGCLMIDVSVVGSRKDRLWAVVWSCSS